MRRTVQILAAGLATAIALAGFASMAVAHKTTIGSQHTIDFTPDVASDDRFTGQVSSKKAFCERGRSITLYRVVGYASVPDEKVATTKTNRSGVWSKDVGNAQAGTYYAKAAKKVVKSRRHRHVCKAAKSASLSVSPSVSPVLEGLSLVPDTIETDGKSTGTVSLSVSTEEDLTVSLESSDALVATVPGGVTVSAGQDTADFEINGLAAGETEIKASLNGTSFKQILTVNDP